MKTPAVNPYLPAWEYIPDAEPHIIGNRLYVFGSHDADGGDEFCLLDYAGWSAPLDDLGNWRYEGIIYRKEQDPLQQDPTIFTPPSRAGKPHLLFAPDVTQGPDGRYYLYYSLDFSNQVSVAVCDTPAGSYEFLGHVARPDGTRPLDFQWFDPAVYVEGKNVYLYVGSAPAEHFPGMPEGPIPGAMVMRLAEDMVTIISEPKCVANGVETAKGTSFEEHPFFEASSMRHFGDKYYFIYSSLQGHELCYAMGDSPEGPFTYQGVLISNGDVGLQGNEQPQCYLGNNHGSLLQIEGRYYIFWHRHTHGGQFSRQGCADLIQMAADGTFAQAEMTSCGLNAGPLDARQRWRASICCCLQGPDRAGMGMLPLLPQNTPESTIPYVTGVKEETSPQGYRSYITNLRPGAALGFKYLDFGIQGCSTLSITFRGTGSLELRLGQNDSAPLAVACASSKQWQTVAVEIPPITGIHPVYFTAVGQEGAFLEFCDFSFQ